MVPLPLRFPWLPAHAGISYLYQSTDPTKTGLQPYDPANPPSDVAMTTTDAGIRVPFIVREETGFEDRDAYRIEVLYAAGRISC